MIPPSASTSESSTPPEIRILLALYRSEAYLREQLDSLAAQDWPNWSLTVSDDGIGLDGSQAILDDFAKAHPQRRIERRRGPERGFAPNFLSLLAGLPEDCGHAALSDHDDVWFPDKLSRAMRALEAYPDDHPVLYCAATTVCDSALTPLHGSSRFRRPPSFCNALVQSLGGGNTMVLNRAAIALARRAAPVAGEIVAHDWWLYQLVTGAGGTALHDPDPVLLYRQHDGNAIGANQALQARVQRLKMILKGRFRSWNEINIAALERLDPWLTPEARDLRDRFDRSRRGGTMTRLRALWASGVYRQSRYGTAALYAACLMRRL